MSRVFDKFWWFVTGAVAGGIITMRAMRKTTTPAQVRDAALATGADVLDLTARALRPKRNR